MPKKSTGVEFNTFTKGIITEASLVNFPPDASLDEQNFEIKKDGTRGRRLGLDLEDGFGLPVVFNYDIPLISYVWESVNNDSSLNFLVVQARAVDSVTPVLYFFDLATQPYSANVVGAVSMGAMGAASIKYAFTSVDGILIVVNGGPEVGVVSYDGTTFTFTTDRIQVRDLWGVEET
jgi:hypothetical protein